MPKIVPHTDPAAASILREAARRSADRDRALFLEAMSDHCDRVQKAVGGEPSIDVEARTVRHLISSSRADRAGDVVRQDGLDFTEFKRNPVVPWAHNYDKPPVGRNMSLTVGADETQAVTRFAETPFAEEIFQLYVDDVLRAWSIGFRPKRWNVMMDDQDSFVGVEYLEAEVYEYSGVVVPMNPDALTLAVKRGVVRDTAEDFRREVESCYGPLLKVAGSGDAPVTADALRALADTLTRHAVVHATDDTRRTIDRLRRP